MTQWWCLSKVSLNDIMPESSFIHTNQASLSCQIKMNIPVVDNLSGFVTGLAGVILKGGNTVWCCYNDVNFLQNIHKRHPITYPLGQAMGCLLWLQPLIDNLPQFLQWYVCAISYYIGLCYNDTHIITALDCIWWGGPMDSLGKSYSGMDALTRQ